VILPWWAKPLAAVLVIVAAVAGWQVYSGRLVARGDAAGYARAQAEYHSRENEALKQALADKARLERELQEVSSDARTKTEKLAVSQRAAADAGRRLRDALAALRGAAQCPGAAAAGGASAGTTAGVLADVQRRLDEAAERVARHADEARIAGLACQRAYEAVK
jgi:hypothetical protein